MGKLFPRGSSSGRTTPSITGRQRAKTCILSERKAEEERKAPTAEEEKRLEKALRSHRGNRIKYDREGFEAERKDEGEKARRGKVSDDEVADEVAKAILETACLQAREQAEKLEQVRGRDYVFAWMLCTDDMWPIVDIVNRLLHDEVAAREYLCDTFYR